MLVVADLRCEYLRRPLAVHVGSPRLSWLLRSDGRDVRQRSYRVRAASTLARLADPDLWDSGPVRSGRSVHVAYRGSQLTSGQACHWQVGVRTTDGRCTWSEPAQFEMGLLTPRDWLASSWICLLREPFSHDEDRPCPRLRTEFRLGDAPVLARLYVTAGGIYEVFVNGARVGAGELAPGWTDYARRIHYDAYDVTSLLRPAANALAAHIGDGWYCGRVGMYGEREHYGRLPTLRMLLVVRSASGATTVVGTDSRWRATEGPVRAADLLLGELHDRRLGTDGWTEPGFDDSDWVAAVPIDGPAGRLVGRPTDPVRVVDELLPERIRDPVPGTSLFDFGCNFAGRVRLRLHGETGTVVRVRHAEALTADGFPYTANLRGARATDTVILRGDPDGEWFEPKFTYHGFRYAEITGCAEVQPTGAVLSADEFRATRFECSDRMLEQLADNIANSARANFLDIPTDCPQRDERLGWLADAHVFVATACYLGDMAAFYAKWLRDVLDAQLPSGAFPDVAPLVAVSGEGAPGWADAVVIVAWQAYRCYADRQLLDEVYPACRRWLEHVTRDNPDLVRRRGVGANYGDWLAIDADTPREVLATAYFAHSADLLGKIARVLGRREEADAHRRLAERIRTVFRAHFVGPRGLVTGDSQTGYALALRFGLVQGKARRDAALRLARDVERRAAPTTGFLGVGHLLPALTATGRVDLAYRLVRSSRFPSWGQAIKCGATSMWERWDGWTPEAGFQTPAMNSFNHCALGSVGEWLFSVVGGIRPDPVGPGWQKFVVQPIPGGGLSRASIRHRTHYGEVRCGWSRGAGKLVVTLEVPANTRATVRLPAPAGVVVEDSLGPLAARPNSRGQVTFAFGSGRYRFSVRDPGAPGARPGCSGSGGAAYSCAGTNGNQPGRSGSRS